MPQFGGQYLSHRTQARAFEMPPNLLLVSREMNKQCFVGAPAHGAVKDTVPDKKGDVEPRQARCLDWEQGLHRRYHLVLANRPSERPIDAGA